MDVQSRVAVPLLGRYPERGLRESGERPAREREWGVTALEVFNNQ